MDTILSEYLSVYLGTDPYTLEAHTAVRRWVQDRIDADNNPRRSGVSQWIVGQVLNVIVSPEIREHHSGRTLARLLS
jgi:hypothetical protein